jgi:transposase-like protein
LPTRQIIRQLLQERITEAVEAVIEAELEEALGSLRHERSSERRGYRNGTVERRITSEHGPLDLTVPRGRIREEDGRSREFRSTVLPRYARRTRRVDEAILGAYLAGANSRRIRKALEPLLGEANLSKSAVSRVVSRLKALFTSWSERDLSQESYPILILDGLNLKVRLARRVVSVPVLVVLGVDEEGMKRLVSLRLAVRESGQSWGEVVGDLQRRGLPGPLLVISDGHRGLSQAVEGWPEAKVQRCVAHKLRNLEEHCPRHMLAELRRDFQAIVYARDGVAARKAQQEFMSKWSKLRAAVARSLEEAGDRLLTFYEFPKAMWKSLRTTNSIENLNREFRRRTKTQASFSTEEAAVTLLYGLVAFGQIRMRKIDGYQHMKSLARTHCQVAA